MKILQEISICERPSYGASDKTGLVMEFAFLTAGVPTANGHVYSREVLSKAILEANARIQSGKSAYGASAHPKKGETLELPDISHLVTALWMKDDKAFARVTVLSETQKGRNVSAILSHDGRIGVSSRGVGDIEGNKVKSLRLDGVDFTLAPASGDFVGQENVIAESVGFDATERVMAITEDCRQRYYAARTAGYRGDLDEFYHSVYKQHHKI